MRYFSTKIIELGSAAFRQPKATSHCRFVHGYRLTAKFTFTSNELDENNWVIDFGCFDEFKKFLQETFDHKLVIAADDPALKEFKALEKAGAVELVVMPDGVGIELFSKFCFEAADSFAKHKTEDRVSCYSVEVFEHEKNSAIYSIDTIESTDVPSEEKVQTAAETLKSKSKTKKVAETKPVEPKPSTTVVPKQVTSPPQAVPVGGKNRPSTWDFGTKWA